MARTSTMTRVLLLGAALVAVAIIAIIVRIANQHHDRATADTGEPASESRDADAPHFWHPPPRATAPARIADEPSEPTPRPHDDDPRETAAPTASPTGPRPAIVNTTPTPSPAPLGIDASTHPGLELAGNTDLTPDEWRVLGERGELRFRLPARGETTALVDESRARSLGLRSESIDPANEVLRRGDAQLLLDVRGYYHDAAGRDPAPMSFDSMLDDIAGRTPSDVVTRVNGELARERGGLSPWQATTPEMTPYERMLRELIAYEIMIERQLAEIVGPANAHALVWGDNALAASAYTYRGAAQ